MYGFLGLGLGHGNLHCIGWRRQNDSDKHCGYGRMVLGMEKVHSSIAFEA